jgi:hypothetical protein
LEQRKSKAGGGIGGHTAAADDVIAVAVSGAVSGAVTAQDHWKIREAVGARMNPLADPSHACAALGIGLCVESLQREMDHRDDACEGWKPSAAAATQRSAWLASANSDQLMDGAARKSAAEQRIDLGASERNARHMATRRRYGLRLRT